MADEKSSINREREKIQLFTEYQKLSMVGEMNQSEHVILQAATGMFSLLRPELKEEDVKEFDKWIAEARALQNASLIPKITNGRDCRNRAYQIALVLVNFCGEKAHEIGWDNSKRNSATNSYEKA